MSIMGLPTSADIYIEVNGKKVAVVQSYSVQTTRTSRVVEAFGQDEPVATIDGQKIHKIELSRLYATDEAIGDGIDFYSLANFNLVVCKPDKRIIFSDCNWYDISESGSLGDMALEKVRLVATNRVTIDC